MLSSSALLVSVISPYRSSLVVTGVVHSLFLLHQLSNNFVAVSLFSRFLHVRSLQERQCRWHFLMTWYTESGVWQCTWPTLTPMGWLPIMRWMTLHFSAPRFDYTHWDTMNRASTMPLLIEGSSKWMQESRIILGIDIGATQTAVSFAFLFQGQGVSACLSSTSCWSGYFI